jgi:hypothetical protein
MYTNDPGGLTELILFYPLFFLSACFCVIALTIVYKFQTAAAVFAIGGILGSIVSGLLFISLLSTKAVPDRNGVVVFVIFCFSVAILWFSSRHFKK